MHWSEKYHFKVPKKPKQTSLQCSYSQNLMLNSSRGGGEIEPVNDCIALSLNYGVRVC